MYACERIQVEDSEDEGSSMMPPLSDAKPDAYLMHAIALRSHISHLYDQAEFCDITLVVGEDRFPAHRVVLASSPYFKALFTHNFLENQQGEVILKDVSSECVTSLLEYMYTGSISLDGQTVEEVFVTADRFSVDALKDFCVEYMCKHVNHSNALRWFSFACIYLCSTLKEVTKQRIRCTFETLYMHNDFSDLDHEQLSELLSDDKLMISSEEFAYKSVMKWMERDFDSKKTVLHHVLHYVRFPLLSTYFFSDVVEVAAMMETEAGQECLRRVRTFVYTGPNRREQFDADLTPRVGMSYKRGLVTVCMNRENNLCIYLISPTSSGSHLLSINCDSLNSSIYSYTCISGGNHLYICNRIASTLLKMHVVDLGNGTWQKRQSPPFSIPNSGIMAVDDKLFAVCKREDGGRYALTYDTHDNLWHRGSPAPLALDVTGAAITTFKGYVFIFSRDCITARYDLRHDKWNNLTPGPVIRSHASAVVYQNKIYVIGGWNHEKEPADVSDDVSALADDVTALDDVNIYDPITNLWNVGPRLPQEVAYPHAVKHRGRILLLAMQAPPSDVPSTNAGVEIAQAWHLSGSEEWRRVDRHWRPAGLKGFLTTPQMGEAAKSLCSSRAECQCCD